MTTPLPLSPFITEPDRRFVLDETKFLADITDDLPIFLTDPSPEFIAAMHRDVLPVLEHYARRGG